MKGKILIHNGLHNDKLLDKTYIYEKILLRLEETISLKEDKIIEYLRLDDSLTPIHYEIVLHEWEFQGREYYSMGVYFCDSYSHNSVWYIVTGGRNEENLCSELSKLEIEYRKSLINIFKDIFNVFVERSREGKWNNRIQ